LVDFVKMRPYKYGKNLGVRLPIKFKHSTALTNAAHTLSQGQFNSTQPSV